LAIFWLAIRGAFRQGRGVNAADSTFCQLDMSGLMIRKIPDARFEVRKAGCLAPLFGRPVYVFYSGGSDVKKALGEVFTEREYRTLHARQQREPVPIIREPNGVKIWWMYRGDFYWEDEGHDNTDIAKAMIVERREKEDRKIERLMRKHGGA
jgi:hypothetical protein